MAAQDGKNLRVEIGNGASPTEVFTPVGGARQDSGTLSRQLVDATNKDTNNWQQSVSGAGTRAMQLQVSGVDDNASSSLAALKAAAFSGASTSFRLRNSSTGEIWLGKFIVTNFSPSAANNDTTQYSFTLDSNGAITYTPGS